MPSAWSILPNLVMTLITAYRKHTEFIKAFFAVPQTPARQKCVTQHETISYFNCETIHGMELKTSFMKWLTEVHKTNPFMSWSKVLYQSTRLKSKWPTNVYMSVILQFAKLWHGLWYTVHEDVHYDLTQSRTCYGSKWLKFEADQLTVQVSAELFLFCTKVWKCGS